MPSTSRNLIERLQDRVEELENLLGLNLPLPRPLNLSRHEWDLLCVLRNVKGRVVTRDFAFQIIYGGLSEGEQPKEVKIIDQIVCRANRKLKDHQIHIRAEPKVGYYLDKWSRQRLEELTKE